MISTMMYDENITIKREGEVQNQDLTSGDRPNPKIIPKTKNLDGTNIGTEE